MKWLRVIAGSAALLCACSALGQEILLKVHHPLPPSSNAHQKVLEPWCAKITAESKNRIKCQIYPSMQLGGSVPQLYDQVKDGVVDVIWTVAGYSAARFPLVEVFELPFFVNNAESTSKALWDYVQLYDADEFKDVHPIAFHVHGGGVFSMIRKPIIRRALVGFCWKLASYRFETIGMTRITPTAPVLATRPRSSASMPKWSLR